MTEAFKSIEPGWKDALAHGRGETAGIIHEIEIHDPDVQAIQAQTGLSQTDFARSIGVKKAGPSRPRPHPATGARSLPGRPR